MMLRGLNGVHEQRAPVFIIFQLLTSSDDISCILVSYGILLTHLVTHTPDQLEAVPSPSQSR